MSTEHFHHIRTDSAAAPPWQSNAYAACGETGETLRAGADPGAGGSR